MTTELLDVKRLEEFIKLNNISLNFLNSNLDNLHHLLNYEMSVKERKLFSNFLYNYHDYTYINFFELLTKSKEELLKHRLVGTRKILKIMDFLAKFNCHIGMFQGYSLATFKHIMELNISINDLNDKEKNLALFLINELVKDTQDDNELGKEIRRIFSVIKR